jgi:hypothetical protein
MMPPLLLQIPTPPAGSIENVLLALAAIGSMLVLGRKLFPRRPQGLPPQAEIAILGEKLASLETKVDTLADKLDHLGESVHHHLNQLEAGLARVDERTRK